MPRRVKVTDTVFARGVRHLADDINAIEEKHGIQPADLVRRLLEAACQFYRRHGWFSFPVLIIPEKFHVGEIKPEEVPAHLMDKYATGMLTLEEMAAIKARRGKLYPADNSGQRAELNEARPPRGRKGPSR